MCLADFFIRLLDAGLGGLYHLIPELFGFRRRFGLQCLLWMQVMWLSDMVMIKSPLRSLRLRAVTADPLCQRG
jgi:hypothetical protein